MPQLQLAAAQPGQQRVGDGKHGLTPDDVFKGALAARRPVTRNLADLTVIAKDGSSRPEPVHPNKAPWAYAI